MQDPRSFFASTTNEIIIPTSTTDIHSVITRWSDERLQQPAIIVIPSTREDIIAAIQYARQKNLTILAGAGGHKVVPVNDKTLYLDLRKFKKIEVNREKATVEIGGAVTNLELMTELLKDGFYTTYANSGAVSMAGLVLGGGFCGALSSIHGLAIDNVVAFEGVTASGEVIKVDQSASDPKHKALFDILCGAGYGLLVITSHSMKIHKLSALNLDDTDKLWVRKYTFPGKVIGEVVDFFQKLLPVKPKLMPLILCVRAPPNAPFPGAPVIILSITYYGPSSEASKIVDPIVASTDIEKFAIASETTLAPFTSIFDGSKMIDAHGGFKAQHMSRAHSFSTSTIVSAFNRWKQLGEEVPDARAFSVFLVWGYNPTATIENGLVNDKRPFIGRDRSMFGNAITWYNKPESKAAVEKYATDISEILQQDDSRQGYPGATLPNNFRDNSKVHLGYTDDMLVDIRRVHAVWNPDSLFYNVLEDSGT
ncbi:hypothetical protein BGW36DRAFT_445658 [Talaromyces proteolyticus]|uniref:FAD-binding PCMH-type domain-containing protein n=1 Tax=Talaromyces proteolyticus TaxID=1131652 RepID=A0AAD4KXD3_9EURO|nr:uncharacterized protein BGW36DRAFT_445658 [Talaromyces proteolyticus]KAH8702046.1 hypothetical protein BGW36DRAFT_445658 [Talaromyces proteolyticus]